MRKVLRSFIGWLDRRFPERVVITQAEFEKLKQDMIKLSMLTSNEERLKKIETEINKFNIHMGFGGSVLPKGMERQFQR